MTSQSDQPSETKRVFSRTEAKLVLAVGSAWILTGIFKQSSLIDPVPLPLTYFAALVGFGSGALLIARVLNRSEGRLTRESTIAIFVLPFFALFFAVFLARTAYEELKFRGAQTISTFEEATVFDKDTKWRRSAGVTFGPNTRGIIVRIDEEVYSSLGPWSQPGGDCLLLEVQTGRDGVRRAIGPNFLEPALGVDSYRICK